MKLPGRGQAPLNIKRLNFVRGPRTEQIFGNSEAGDSMKARGVSVTSSPTVFGEGNLSRRIFQPERACDRAILCKRNVFKLPYGCIFSTGFKIRMNYDRQCDLATA